MNLERTTTYWVNIEGEHSLKNLKLLQYSHTIQHTLMYTSTSINILPIKSFRFFRFNRFDFTGR